MLTGRPAVRVDAGVVDHRVHRAEPVDLAGDVARLVEVGKVADDDRRRGRRGRATA